MAFCSFFLTIGRNLPQCVNVANNKVVAVLRKALSTFIYDNKTYCEVRINLTESGQFSSVYYNNNVDS